MRFVFATNKLRTLYTTGRGRYAPDAIRGFFRVMGHIEQAVDERDLYNLKGLRFEKLSGGRRGQHSLRLNDQWRLILERSRDVQGSMLIVIEIVDYH